MGIDRESCAVARIPIELLRQVILELKDLHGQHALRPCVKVSRTWREISLPLFLRHIEIICDLRTDRLSLLRDWLAIHEDMKNHVKVLEITGHLRLARATWNKPYHIDVNLDVLKDVISQLPNLADLRLLHVAITKPPTLAHHTPPVAIPSLTLRSSGNDDDYETGHRYWFGLPMFSTLSAVLSVAAPDTVILRGGYKKSSRDRPDDVLPPQLMTIRSLDLGKHWLDPYFLGVLAADTLEHLAVVWPWQKRDLAAQLHALVEHAGRTLKSMDIYLDNQISFMGGTPTEDWGLLGRIIGTCTDLRDLSLRVSAYVVKLQPGARANFPSRPFYHTVLSAASRSLRTLTLPLEVHIVSHGHIKETWPKRVANLVGLEVLDLPWMRERFTMLESIKIELPDIHDIPVIEKAIQDALPSLREAGLLSIVRVPWKPRSWKDN
ncbi:hypothetical protein L226DRAFT_560840 [Lentinus tigrinus ALCF2SS1-7]|uniref:F-box domain-containing protein n=1 Tax=Lentinus tigrinus ALCF2SS1-6 TaxID=1328759 RepID=A0A5C2RW68_9APHY|nr:hypothetical protein L227DRAFT_657271 [Lentinus tigrinus ALCF2SS1-6]RPD74142.1 hypothetical protein L226DRAFT_560840 [Lentinus tigrinus ALCF2SS1-7]